MDPPVHCTQLHCAFVSVRYPESNGSGVILALKRIRSASSQAWYLRCIRRNKFGQENWSSVKSWPNGSLASCFGTADWLAFRLAACTWVCLLSDRLALTPRWLALTCVDLRWLALTLVELKVVCKLTTFFTVWPPKASRHKLIASHLYMCELAGRLSCESLWLRLSQVLVLQTSVDLRRFASPFQWPGSKTKTGRWKWQLIRTWTDLFFVTNPVFCFLVHLVPAVTRILLPFLPLLLLFYTAGTCIMNYVSSFLLC